MTEIPLGFADSRIHEKDGELYYDMWPAFGTQMTLPLRGAVSDKRVIRNTDDELVLAKGIFRYTFRFSPRHAGPDALRYSVSILGVVPLGTHRGDVSNEGKSALRNAFIDQSESSH